MAAAVLFVLQDTKRQHGIFQESKEAGNDQESIQSLGIPYGKVTKTKKTSHKRESDEQE